jgi:hypothetical protein
MGMMRMVGMGAGLVGAGYLASKMLRNRSSKSSSGSKTLPLVRDAGADNMRDPPETWTKTDQISDESFPASDPPGRY